ncbi:MAG: hypothetical protein Tsb0021_12780 [Chlamydiales bacterium]
MADFNNINLDQLFNTQQTSQTQEGAPAEQFQNYGQPQNDSISTTQQFPDTFVPNNPDNPDLIPPNFNAIDPQQQQAQQPQEDSVAALEQRIRAAIETDPELAAAAELLLNRRGVNTDEGRRQLLEEVRRFIQQRGGSATTSQALANQLQGLINSAPPGSNAAELQNALNTLRSQIFNENNPAFEFLVAGYESQLIQEGVDPETARLQAQARALADIDAYLEENDINTPLIGTHPALGDAINTALARLFGADFPPEVQEAIQGGIEGIGLFLGFITQGINNIQNVDLDNVQSGDTVLNTVNNSLNTLDELTRTTLEITNTSNLPEGDRLALREYLQLLSEVIRDLQQILTRIQISDAEQAQVRSRTQAELADQRGEATRTQILERLEQIQKQRKISGILKIVGYIVGAVLTLVGALLSPFTGGASLAATLAVSALIFATTVALSETGILAKGFQELANLIAEAIEPEWAGKLVAAITFLVLVAILSVVTYGAASGASSALATTLGLQIGLTLTTTVLSSSNAIGLLVESIGTAAGASREEILGWTIALTVLVTILISIVAAKAGSKVQEKFGGKVPDLSKFDIIGRGFRRIGDSAAIRKAGELISRFNNFVRRHSSLYTRLDDALDPTNANISPEALNRLGHIRRHAATGMAIAQGADGVSRGVVTLVASLESARSEEELAELEALIELLTQTIRILERVVDGLLGDAENTIQNIVSLTELFDSAVQGLRNAVANVSNANI